MVLTYQDFEKLRRRSAAGAVQAVITAHRASPAFRMAMDADTYDRQKNSTITRFVRWLYNNSGEKEIDTQSSNNKLASNFFRRLNVQRCTYSLGNGVQFESDVKEKLGADFDTRLNDAGYYALIHGAAFMFLNVDHVHVFKLTEFAPLYDEETGALRAGVRFWQIDADHPLTAVLYEEDGYTKLKAESMDATFEVIEAKRAYRIKTKQAPVDDEPEIIGEENYTALPIVPVYGTALKQSTLTGMKAKIDAYDLIQSGYANDLDDCSEIYWIVSNAGGMDSDDLNEFRNRLKLHHIANVENADDVAVTPYTQEVPYASRKTFLDDIRASIYEDFGGLDVHTVSAGATNDHIDAAYQPLDENADDFEYQIIDAVQILLKLIGVNDAPTFKRNRISNQKEYTEMVMLASTVLDRKAVLDKLPWLTPDDVEGILERGEMDDFARWNGGNDENGNDESGVNDEPVAGAVEK